VYRGYSRYRVLRVFFDHPSKKFFIREVSRKTDISYPSVRNHINGLLEEGFIKKDEEGMYPRYSLGDSKKTRIYKRNDLLARLYESGLVKELEGKTRPNCIILYGSAVEGRDDERGDVDLFIQAEEKDVDLEKYEKKINRKISLLFEPEIKHLNKELLNNLVNGVTLKGYLKVV